MIRACLDASVKYAKERKTFGVPIGEHQLVKEMIAQMVSDYDAARLLWLRAGWLKNEGRRNTRETSLAKWFATVASERAASDAVQIHGGNGFSDEYPVGRFFRNCKAAVIYEGTREIHKIMQADYALGYPAGQAAAGRAARLQALAGRGPRGASRMHRDDLFLEFVRVVEQAAIAAARTMGQGDRKYSDQVAVEAMRKEMESVDIDGTIVIGEGERDEAPMLFIGEKVGRGGTPVDIAVDPLEGTNLCATGAANAIAVLAASEKGGLLNAPDIYMEKLVVGPTRPRGRSTSTPRWRTTSRRSPAASTARSTTWWSSSSTDRATSG